MLKVNCKLKGATVHESFREEYGGQGKTVLSLGLLRKQKVQRWQRKPSSVIWQHLNDLLSLFRGMHFYTAVYADVQPWDLNTLAGCWRLISSVKIPFLPLFPLDGSLSIRTGTEVQKNKTKACTAAPGRRECERDESRKVYHEIKWWGSAAASWGRCSLYWFFQHCHLVTVTSLYERLGTKCRLWSSQYVADGWGVCVCTCVCVCVCEGTWSVQRPIWGESQGLSHFLFTLGDRWRRRCVDTSAVFLQYVWVQYVCFQKNHEHLKSLHWSKVRRRYFTFNTCSFVILFVVLKKAFPLYILCCVYIYQHIYIHICCYSLAAISVSSDTEHVFAWI